MLLRQSINLKSFALVLCISVAIRCQPNQMKPMRKPPQLRPTHMINSTPWFHSAAPPPAQSPTSNSVNRVPFMRTQQQQHIPQPSSYFVGAASERAQQQVLLPARLTARTTTTNKPIENQSGHQQQQFHQWRDPNGKLLICYYATKQTVPHSSRGFVVPAEQLNNNNNKPQQQRRRSILADAGGRLVVIAPEFAPNQSIGVGARSNSVTMVNSNEIGIDRVDSLAHLFKLANNRRRTIADRQDNGATIAANQSIVRQLAPSLEFNFVPNNDQVGVIVFEQNNRFKHDLSQNNNRQAGGRAAGTRDSGQEMTSHSEHLQRPIVTTTISTPMLRNIPIRTAPTRPPEHAPTSVNGERVPLLGKANNRDQHQQQLSPSVGQLGSIISTTLGTFPSSAAPSLHPVSENQNIDRPNQALVESMPIQNSDQQNQFYYFYNVPISGGSGQSAQASPSASVSASGSNSPGPSQNLLAAGSSPSLSSHRPVNLNQQQQHELSGTTLTGFNSNIPVQRGKSLQLTDSEIVHFKPAAPTTTMQTSSTSSHSSSMLPSSVTILPAANSPTSSYLAQNSPNQSNQQPPVDRLIVSNRPKSLSSLTTTGSGTALVGQQQYSSSENSDKSDLLKVSVAAAASSSSISDVGESFVSGKTTPVTMSQPSPGSSLHFSTPSNGPESAPSSGLSIKLDEPLPLSVNRNFHPHQSSLSNIKQTTIGLGGANSLSAALVSSPLSTMFDVFGAASQYLMRFKPSSLISPSSFAAFNSISGGSNDSHNKLRGNSSLSSLVSSLPFAVAATGHHHHHQSQEQKSSLFAGIRNGSQASSREHKGGFLSRLSQQLSPSHQPRREDICGRTIQTAERRIIGGEGAKYGEFPYQVHIKIAKHQCGGALIDRQSIVTAAHCVYHFITRAPVNKLQIVIGAYDIEDEQYQEQPPQYFKVNKVKLHPNFRFSASHPDRYDIAILKLDHPVTYTDNVLPVCLPGKELKYDNMVGTVTGFGKTDPSLSNRYGTRLLQKVDVPIIENSECERWHRTRGIDLKIFPEMMCAGYEDGLKDACVGDSGGPLVVKTPVGGSSPNEGGAFRWTLAGITSAGFGCAQSRQPGIYHRVSHTVDWILENLD